MTAGYLADLYRDWGKPELAENTLQCMQATKVADSEVPAC